MHAWSLCSTLLALQLLVSEGLHRWLEQFGQTGKELVEHSEAKSAQQQTVRAHVVEHSLEAKSAQQQQTVGAHLVGKLTQDAKSAEQQTARAHLVGKLTQEAKSAEQQTARAHLVEHSPEQKMARAHLDGELTQTARPHRSQTSKTQCICAATAFLLCSIFLDPDQAAKGLSPGTLCFE